MGRHILGSRVGRYAFPIIGAVLTALPTAAQMPRAPAPNPVAGRVEREPAEAEPEPLTTLREGFESSRVSWRKEDADDVAVQILAHDRSEESSHDGQRAERFRFVSQGLGSSIYYSLALPNIPVHDDTEISLYVRASQPGIQLIARIILPGDVDPQTGEPAFVSVSGDTYQDVDRWQRLELTDLPRAMERQARILRIQSNRKVDLRGAYIERLVLNLYGGGGESEVFVDDLTLTPVPESVVVAFREQFEERNSPARVRGASSPALAERSGLPGSATEPGPAGSATAVRLVERTRLSRDGRDWFPTILDAPGVYLDQALPFGFDVVKVDPATANDPEAIRRVVAMGSLLMPDLGARGSGLAEDRPDGGPLEALNAAMAFPEPEAVAFWSLGDRLGAPADPSVRADQLQRTRTLVTALGDQAETFPKLSFGLVADEFPKYAVPGQNLDLIGVHAQNWGTMMAPLDALEYLTQRRNLTALWSLNAPHLAWIDVAAPRAMRSAVWGEDVPPAWGSPRVQPEQIRQAVYLALMAGYRGLGFRADGELTRAGGRPVLYELGLLNAEIDLVESILARTGEGGPVTPLVAKPAPPKRRLQFKTGGPQGSISQYDEKPAAEMKELESVRVVSIPTKDGRGRLVLLADLAAGSQWQPPQLAYNDVEVVVRGSPASAQAYQISLGGRRVLETNGQEVGGIRFTLPEFDTATMVLLTTDYAMAERLERELRAIRPRAVDLAIKQAQMQYEWVAEINGRLALDGAQAPDANDLLAKARQTLQSAIEAVGRESYEEAWDEARRVGRSLRYLMREHWEAAARAMAAAATQTLPIEYGRNPNTNAPVVPAVVPPVASPPLVAFNTLPQHYVWCDWIRHGTFGRDLLDESGDFDRATPATLQDGGWTDAGHHQDRLRTSIRLVRNQDAKLPTRPPVRDRDGRVVRPAGPGQVLELRVGVENDSAGIDNLPPFLDQPAAAIQSPPVPVAARQLVRIRVKVKLPRKLPPGAGGLIVRDSLGGEPLQYRTTEAMNYWSEVVLFRRAPSDGDMTVTLGLAGFGIAYFDDLRIEPLEQYSPPTYAQGNPGVTPGAFYPPARPATPPRAAAALPLVPERRAR